MTPENARDKFKLRRNLWIECLGGDDRHSIMRQIYRMIWNAATFRVINEARRIAPPAVEGGVQLNGLMHELIDEGFFEGQELAIRRLTDNYPLTDDGRGRDVWSLTSLLDDMQKHAPLMTRANIFAAESLEYDFDLTRQRADEYREQKLREGEQAFFFPKELDWGAIRHRHEQIDFLAGVTAEHRSPHDAVRGVVMERLKEMVRAECSDVHIHINKFIAHAASPESRQKVNADKASITLSHLYRAHTAICKTANFVDIYLLTGTCHQLLPTRHPGQFAYIDRPLVTKEGIATLSDVWDRYHLETEEWSKWGLEGFRQEFPL